VYTAGEFEAAARGQGEGGSHGVGISFGGAATMVASSIGHVKLPGRKKGGRNDPQENEAQVLFCSYMLIQYSYSRIYIRRSPTLSSACARTCSVMSSAVHTHYAACGNSEEWQ
jgi:hypothetical protein